MKELKFIRIVENFITEINLAKNRSETIHKGGNIESSGKEIEELIREKIGLFLPERYLVKQGHIINSEGLISNQFDIIIFDRLNTPRFFESKNNTVYYPIESVLAVGEIKKTLRKKDPIEFGKKIKYLKEDMKRELIPNTLYPSGINLNSSLIDVVTMTVDRKYKNSLFSFLFAIDEKDIKNLEVADDNKYMPNDIYVLNYGYYIYGEIKDKNFITKLEDEEQEMDSWISVKKPGAICLAMMLNQLINHLNKCYVEPFSIGKYMSDLGDFGIEGSAITVYSTKRS